MFYRQGAYKWNQTLIKTFIDLLKLRDSVCSIRVWRQYGHGVLKARIITFEQDLTHPSSPVWNFGPVFIYLNPSEISVMDRIFCVSEIIYAYANLEIIRELRYDLNVLTFFCLWATSIVQY